VLLAVVARGMGFPVELALEASTIAIVSTFEAFSNCLDFDPHKALIEGFTAANQRMLASLPEAGSSCATVFIRDNHLYLGTIGECLVLLFRQKRYHRLSFIHDFYNHLVDSGMYTAEQRNRLSIRNGLMRVLGGDDDSKPDARIRIADGESMDSSVQGMPLEAGDIIILSSELGQDLERPEMAHLLEIGDPQEFIDAYLQTQQEYAQFTSCHLIAIKVMG
jgi:serine/threonine protein phosphatase PrpC